MVVGMERGGWVQGMQQTGLPEDPNVGEGPVRERQESGLITDFCCNDSVNGRTTH